MHLMMDALNESDDSTVREALQRAASYIADKFNSTSVGAWFYHDELECSETGMHRAPFKWWPSTVLGKSPQNMLVLNTQLDTLVALDRYRALTGDVQYDAAVRSGFKATEATMALRPMEWLYRLVFSAINLTLLPTERGSPPAAVEAHVEARWLAGVHTAAAAPEDALSAARDARRLHRPRT